MQAQQPSICGLSFFLSFFWTTAFLFGMLSGSGTSLGINFVIKSMHESEIVIMEILKKENFTQNDAFQPFPGLMHILNEDTIFGPLCMFRHLHTQDSLQLALKFLFQDTDVLIVSYPKSGTTWMQEIVTLISSRGDPCLSQSIPNWTRAPWLEQYYCADLLKTSTSAPRVLTTHLPHHLLGSTLQGSKARIIYVSRNPKDVLVSFFHFHKMANFLPDAGSFPEFLNQFLEGTLHFGSWFDHVKGWTSQAAALNLLHVTYEEMSMDLHGTINRVSAFLQRPLLEHELNDCVKHCSFSSMKDNKMINYTLIPDEILDHSKGCFMRKGEIGDWKTMFTEEQNQYFESTVKSKMQDCTLNFVWEKTEKEQSQLKV